MTGNNLTKQTEQAAQVPASPMQMIQQVVMSPDADIEKLERMMALEERWNAREAEKAFIHAMGQFQMQCPVIKAMKQGHNYTYAPIGDIIAQTKRLMSELGLMYRFEQKQSDGVISVTCIATHASGHAERTTVEAPADDGGKKSTIQAIGSAVTYLRRYALCGAFGIVTADPDHDGRMAGQQANEPTEVSQALEIMRLIAEKGINQDKVKKQLCLSLGWPADSEFEFSQIGKKAASELISMLKKTKGAGDADS